MATDPYNPLVDIESAYLPDEVVVWDWSIAETIHSPTTLEFLRDVQHQPISEADFVARYTQLPYDKPHRSKARSPSVARSQYRRLKQRYGFFASK